MRSKSILKEDEIKYSIDFWWRIESCPLFMPIQHLCQVRIILLLQVDLCQTLSRFDNEWCFEDLSDDDPSQISNLTLIHLRCLNRIIVVMSDFRPSLNSNLAGMGLTHQSAAELAHGTNHSISMPCRASALATECWKSKVIPDFVIELELESSLKKSLRWKEFWIKYF